MATLNDQVFVFAYLGPETFVPLLSVIAGGIGILLAAGRNAWSCAATALMGFVRRVVGK